MKKKLYSTVIVAIVAIIFGMMLFHSIQSHASLIITCSGHLSDGTEYVCVSSTQSKCVDNNGVWVQGACYGKYIQDGDD